MKKLTFVFVICLLHLGVYAQQVGFKAALGKSIQDLWAAKTPAELLPVVNQLDRIATAEKTQWLPYYYAAFGATQLSFMETDNNKRDLYLDQAQRYVDQLQQLRPRESEVFVLQAMVFQGRIQVDPMTRGMKFMGRAEEALAQAKALNPENPRTYFLLGQQKLHTPSMFGGGPEVALPFLVQAKEKFAAFKPLEDLAPNWGEKVNLGLVQSTEQKLAAGK